MMAALNLASAQVAPDRLQAVPRAAGPVLPLPNAGSLPNEARRIPFSKPGSNQTLQLRTIRADAFDFGLRSDELVTKALLRVRYTHSPSLIPGQSHIKVRLNGEAVGVLPMQKDNAGKQLMQEIELDPRLIAGFNKLVFEFVGHYANECEDQLNSSLWADISSGSELLLNVSPIVVASDLALLPKPFFDKQDLNRLKLPFIFNATPSYSLLQAAGITSSWFGKLASWRGARFPTFLEEPPKGHAVVLATNSERPKFLADMAPFTGPGLTVLTNPADGYSKLLLLSGRDGNDVKRAATALVLGNAVLSGNHIEITDTAEPPLRKAYDAPNWVRLDRPMKFGELVESPRQLQVAGHTPDPIRVEMQLPPDLYLGRGGAIPANFSIRYSPPLRPGESRLTMSVNDELVQAVNLRPAGKSTEMLNVAFPKLENGLLREKYNVLIPGYKLGTRNQLQYAFSFPYQRDTACRDLVPDNVQAMIDPDSEIDLSGFPHYAEMPNLSYFATAGFPFTKYADLAQTVVVLPRKPTVQDIEVMLTLLGHLGETSGYPAIRMTVAGPDDPTALKDRDLLLIGTAPNQALLSKWEDKLPAVILGDSRSISQAVRPAKSGYDWFGSSAKPSAVVSTHQTMRGNGALAAFLGFESPISPKRSVVAATAVQDKDLTQILDTFDKRELFREMHGSAVFIRSGSVDSIVTGNTYQIGGLPFFLPIKYILTERPIVSILIAIGIALLILYMLWRAVRAAVYLRRKETK